MVRVQESSAAPHFGKKRNLIYIRIDNESEQADADSIKRLMEKHQKGNERSKQALESRKLASPEIAGTPEFPNWLTTQVIVFLNNSFLDRVHSGNRSFSWSASERKYAVRR
jgi:hypothetical protein